LHLTESADSPLHLTVQTNEYLGHETLLHDQLASHNLTLRLPGLHIAPSGSILAPRLDDMPLCFDAEGNALIRRTR